MSDVPAAVGVAASSRESRTETINPLFMADQVTSAVARGDASTSVPPLGAAGVDTLAARTLADPTKDKLLEAAARTELAAAVTDARKRLVKQLTRGLGVGGANWTRSTEVRAFRAQMKQAARDQARADIQVLQATLDAGPATKAYVDLIARGEAYGLAKGSVDDELTEVAESWVLFNWDAQDKDQRWINSHKSAVSEAIRTALEEGTDDARAIVRAQQAGRDAAKRAIASRLSAAEAAARSWKNAIVKPDRDDGTATAQADGVRGSLAQGVALRAKQDEVGARAINAAFTAATTDEGMRAIGKLLDKVVAQPGDIVELSVELKIPIPGTPFFVTLTFEGKAGRGVTGFTTAGFAALGNPKRLEVQARMAIGGGVGVSLLGLDIEASASIGFFLRAGADEGTRETMMAFSYGAYQAANRLSPQFGNWWAGGGVGVSEGKTQRAEMWAAMVEEQVFDADGSAFADTGLDLGADAKVDAGVAAAEARLRTERMTRYDKEGLEASLGTAFAEPVKDKQAAKDRRGVVAGRQVRSYAVETEVSVDIAGQGVSFGVAFSGERADGDDNAFAKNWAVDITAGLSLPGDAPGTLLDQVAAGFVAGALSGVKSMELLVQKATKPDAGGSDAVAAVDITLDITRALNAAFASQVSTALGDAVRSGDEAVFGTTSTIEAVLSFGRASGRWSGRFELRETKTLSASIDVANAGVEVSAKRGRRLFAVSFEHGQDPNDADNPDPVLLLHGEALGVRGKKKL